MRHAFPEFPRVDIYEGNDSSIAIISSIYQSGFGVVTIFESHEESKSSAFKAPSEAPAGGGTRSTIAFSIAAVLISFFAEMRMTSLGLMPNTDSICAVTRSGSEAGRSIL